MKRYCTKLLWLTLSSALIAEPAAAGLIDYFKDEEGHTKWQWVANFSSSLLILILSFVLIGLVVNYRKLRRANRELHEIRQVLEDRVRERTANLDDSNRQLRHVNQQLEGEIDQHRQTTDRLRVSEAYVQSILQSMPSILIGLNAKCEITQWNRGAETVTGITHEQAIGRNLWKAYPVITIAPEQVQAVFDSGEPTSIKHSQRGQYYFDITIYPLVDQTEPGVVVIVDNVTQRTLAENMIIQQDKMASMGELAAIMAHDLAIPLEAMERDLTSAGKKVHEIVESSAKDDHLQTLAYVGASINDAIDNGKRVRSIITNLLDFARAPGEQKRPAMITDIIDHAIELADGIIADSHGLAFSGITVRRHYDKNLPMVNCFSTELQQVFLNLFRHACFALADKAARLGDQLQPTITIEVNERYDSLWIKIQHNGRGLTAQEQRDIFEPFFSSTINGYDVESQNRLSFPYFIITEYHDGEMAVTSDEEIGSTFHIQLQL